MTIGERVRCARKTLGLTLEEFGKRIGLKKNSVSQIENGHNELTDANAVSICREFNVCEEWLRYGTGDMFEPAASDDLDALAKEYHLSNSEKILIDRYIKLDESSRRAVIDFIIDTASALSGGHPFNSLPDEPDALEDPDDTKSDAG